MAEQTKPGQAPASKQPPAPAPPQQAVQKFDESTLNAVVARVNTFTEAGAINLPQDYSVGNALRGAWLVLQDMKDSKTNTPLLQHVTKASVANAMLDMVTNGLSVSKKQGSFVKYGNQLTFQREYFGSIALAKRYAGMKNVIGNVVYEKDTFEVEVDPKTGRRGITKHIQQIDNIDPAKIKGAYAVVTLEDGSTFLELMSMQQIRKSWEQGPTKGTSPAHVNFPDQMAIKTVINRALKVLINSSDDSELMNEDGKPKPITIDIESGEPEPAPIVEEPIQDALPVSEPEPAQPTSPY